MGVRSPIAPTVFNGRTDPLPFCWLRFDVQHGRIRKSVDRVYLDNVFPNVNDSTSTQGNEIRADGRSGGKDVTQRIVGIPAPVNLEDRALLGSVVAVKPVQDPD